MSMPMVAQLEDPLVKRLNEIADLPFVQLTHHCKEAMEIIRILTASLKTNTEDKLEVAKALNHFNEEVRTKIAMEKS